jgi:hypothetical protein
MLKSALSALICCALVISMRAVWRAMIALIPLGVESIIGAIPTTVKKRVVKKEVNLVEDKLYDGLEHFISL